MQLIIYRGHGNVEAMEVLYVKISREGKCLTAICVDGDGSAFSSEYAEDEFEKITSACIGEKAIYNRGTSELMDALAEEIAERERKESAQ